MDILVIYAWTKLDLIRGFMGAAMSMAIVASFFSGMSWGIDNSELGRRVCKKAVPLALVFAFLFVAIPSTKQVALIVAGTATYRAITSERGTKLASAFADYIERQAMKLLKEEKD